MPRMPWDGSPLITRDEARHLRDGSLPGEDAAMVVGTPLYAMFSGTARSRIAGTGGWAVTVYKDGRSEVVGETFHLWNFIPDLGSTGGPNGRIIPITEGQLVGYSGGAKGHWGAGNSTGPHCHAHVYAHGLLRPRQSVTNYLRSVGGLELSGLDPIPLGRPVLELQQSLKGLGYELAVDGVAGDETDRVLRQFQTDAGLVADGVPGSYTWAALTRFKETGMPLTKDELLLIHSVKQVAENIEAILATDDGNVRAAAREGRDFARQAQLDAANAALIASQVRNAIGAPEVGLAPMLAKLAGQADGTAGLSAEAIRTTVATAVAGELAKAGENDAQQIADAVLATLGRTLTPIK